MSGKRGRRLAAQDVDAALAAARRSAAARPDGAEAQALRDFDAWMEQAARAVADALLNDRKRTRREGDR